MNVHHVSLLKLKRKLQLQNPTRLVKMANDWQRPSCTSQTKVLSWNTQTKHDQTKLTSLRQSQNTFAFYSKNKQLDNRQTRTDLNGISLLCNYWHNFNFIFQEATVKDQREQIVKWPCVTLTNVSTCVSSLHLHRINSHNCCEKIWSFENATSWLKFLREDW